MENKPDYFIEQFWYSFKVWKTFTGIALQRHWSLVSQLNILQKKKNMKK